MPGKVETSLESSNETMYYTTLQYWEMTVAQMSLHLPNFDELEMTHITSGTVKTRFTNILNASHW